MRSLVIKYFLFIFLIYEHNLYFQVLTAEDGFITTETEHFMLNGSPFYANGFNAYWLTYIASNLSQRNKITSAFQEASNHGLIISRTWAFKDGGYSPLQYSPGFYNEEMFQGLDFVISEARKYGIKLILSLVNNYEDYGGKKQYVNWARSQGHNISSDDEFFTNLIVKGFYKNHIKVVLTRQNSINKVVYKDDPTIMAWELMNEPRCSTDASGKTIQDPLVFYKILHTFSLGLDNGDGFLLEINRQESPPRSRSRGLLRRIKCSQATKQSYFQVGTDFITNNQIPDIDFATVHSYPDQWLSSQSEDNQLTFLNNWLNSHIEDAQNILQKPLLFAEFGKSSKDPGYSNDKRDQLFDTVYSAIYSSARNGGAAAGGLFWQFLTEGMDDFRDGYEIVFSESPSTVNLIQEQSQKLNRIRKIYAKLRN